MTIRGNPEPITMRALMQRVNRVLRKENQILRKTRGTRWSSDLGEYYAVDLGSNVVTAAHVDPEVWAREMGVLRADERLKIESDGQQTDLAAGVR